MRPRVSGRVELRLGSEKLAKAVARALKVEAENPPDTERGSVSITVEGATVIVVFAARDPSSARALLNAYLSLAAATVEALRKLG